MDMEKVREAVRLIDAWNDKDSKENMTKNDYLESVSTVQNIAQSVLKYSGELPVKEYPECTVGGHTPDNCPQCAKAYYYQQGIDDCTLAIPAIVEKAVKEKMLAREKLLKIADSIFPEIENKLFDFIDVIIEEQKKLEGK